MPFLQQNFAWFLQQRPTTIQCDFWVQQPQFVRASIFSRTTVNTCKRTYYICSKFTVFLLFLTLKRENAHFLGKLLIVFENFRINLITRLQLASGFLYTFLPMAINFRNKLRRKLPRIFHKLRRHSETAVFRGCCMCCRLFVVILWLYLYFYCIAIRIIAKVSSVFIVVFYDIAYLPNKRFGFECNDIWIWALTVSLIPSQQFHHRKA